MIVNPKTGVQVEESALADATPHALMCLVQEDWQRPYFAAQPYIEALYTLQSLDDFYGVEKGTHLVPYFLTNAATWRGPIAKAVKAELKRRIGVK